MASDLPEQLYDSTYAFTRVLVQVLPDDIAVRARLKEDFPQHRLGLRDIADIRARVEREKVRSPEEPFRLSETYYPADASEAMARRNRRFLEALQAERDLSERRRVEAYQRDTAWLDTASTDLRSPFLTQQSLVDAKWDKAVDDGWWETEL